MEIDMVHDIQKAYRKLLTCISEPGVIKNIDEESKKIHMDIKFFNSTLVLMFMLLDSEVSFKIISKNENEVSSIVRQLTYSKPECIEKADFIFILEDADIIMLKEALACAKPGNLINPHRSATVIVETSKISNEKKFLLKGPGIKDKNYMDLQLNGVWLDSLHNKNVEFPMGIDMIFVDRYSNIICLPRTTEVTKKVD